MFDIGFWELCLIGIVGLLVIGPDRLPSVARTLGHWIGKAQRMIDGVKSDIHREFAAGELRELLGEQKKQIDELQGLVDETRRGVASSTRGLIETGELSWVEQVAEETRQEQAENSIMPPPSSARTDPQMAEDTDSAQNSMNSDEAANAALSGDADNKTA